MVRGMAWWAGTGDGFVVGAAVRVLVLEAAKSVMMEIRKDP
ncbi:MULTISPECIES: hypothetical protein [Azospirillum]|nr:MULTISPECIES: hypothetical protein [Azospirillum]GLR81106.1 hypothetical protein GCM10007856_37880 [Azospirillum oryzae]